MIPLTIEQKRIIKYCNTSIRINQKRLDQCIKNSDTLSSEAGILTPLKALKDNYKKAIKDWKRTKRQKLKEWKKLGFNTSEFEG